MEEVAVLPEGNTGAGILTFSRDAFAIVEE